MNFFFCLSKILGGIGMIYWIWFIAKLLVLNQMMKWIPIY